MAFAQNISSYGLATNRTDVMLPEAAFDSFVHTIEEVYLAVATVDVEKLLDFCNSSKSGEPAHELFVFCPWVALSTRLPNCKVI